MAILSPRLGVNVDHVATVRQARRARFPDPVAASLIAELHGADMITVHLREDRRHIQDHDVKCLKECLQTRLNLEMAATAEMKKFAKATRPDAITLVPEKRAELTTEGGLDVQASKSKISAYLADLSDLEATLSIFIDPDQKQVEAAKFCGADAIEIHTGAYAEAKTISDRKRELKRIEKSAELAASMGLHVHAGHGLDYVNVMDVATISTIEELNIGHSIVARAILVGIGPAVREMKDLMKSARLQKLLN